MSRALLTLLLGVLAVLTLATSALAKVHEHTRGLKTYNLAAEEVEEIMKRHDARHINEKQKHKKHTLKHDPEVQRFMEWKQKHKEGHASAGAAFAGKLPHDFIPHITDHDFHEAILNHDDKHGSLHEDDQPQQHLLNVNLHDEL